MLEDLEKVFFSETHTLGIRRRKEARKALVRAESRVWLEGLDAPLRGKSYNIGDKEFSKPEFSALKQAAFDNSASVLELKARTMLKKDR